MTASYRTRSSAPAELVKRMKTPNDVLQPKLELTERERYHFDLVVSSRETASWSPNDLMLATQLAKTYRRIEELGQLLDDQGYTQVNEKGTQISNPIFAALTQLQSQVQTSNRTLGLSAGQRALTGGNQQQRNASDAKAREVISRVSSDDLLA